MSKAIVLNVVEKKRSGEMTSEWLDVYMAIHSLLGYAGNGDFGDKARKFIAKYGEMDLPYEKRPLECGFAQGVEEYVIQESDRGDVLKSLYLFTPCPRLDATMYDIHEDRTFTVKDFKAVRIAGIVFMVSPYFAHSGGSILDWITRREDCGLDDLYDVKEVAEDGQGEH